MKKLAALALALSIFAMQALPAFACGGLIAPNGSVRLARATTFVAWHNGIEHYLTSFSYQGDVSGIGWIVPLPAVPLKIEEGGAWTLQRLELESHPVTPTLDFAVRAAASQGAAVLEKVKIAALNITVISGSGLQVLNWASQNGFFVNAETSAHLLAYAKASPIFLAAKYDTSDAKRRGLFQGDGTPILITMKTPHIWVPLEVLALDGQQVQADLYLLTDTPVYTSDFNAVVGQSSVGAQLPNAPGFTLAFQEKMSNRLYHDLSTDRNMGWVWPNSWITYLTLDAPDTTVRYDLGVDSSGVIRLAPFGTSPMSVVASPVGQSLPSWLPHLPLGTPQIALTIVILAAVGAGLFLIIRVTRPKKTVEE
jgi:Uncharacterized protein conserved in bacteria (DUF2330)